MLLNASGIVEHVYPPPQPLPSPRNETGACLDTRILVIRQIIRTYYKKYLKKKLPPKTTHSLAAQRIQIYTIIPTDISNTK